jgi:hypothetical protein
MYNRKTKFLQPSTDQLVTEKEGGMLERELSAGIRIYQLIASQMITQCMVTLHTC